VTKRTSSSSLKAIEANRARSIANYAKLTPEQRLARSRRGKAVLTSEQREQGRAQERARYAEKRSVYVPDENVSEITGDSIEKILGGAERSDSINDRGFIEWSPKDHTRALIDEIAAVLEEYAGHLPLTGRQIYYRLIGPQHIKGAKFEQQLTMF
jgi:hypothetical protein